MDRVVLAWPIDRVNFQARQKSALHEVLDGIYLSTIELGQRAVNSAFKGFGEIAFLRKVTVPNPAFDEVASFGPNSIDCGLSDLNTVKFS